jgi:hypothetical protein
MSDCICPAEDMGGPHMDHCSSQVDFGPANTQSYTYVDPGPNYSCYSVLLDDMPEEEE